MEKKYVREYGNMICTRDLQALVHYNPFERRRSNESTVRTSPEIMRGPWPTDETSEQPLRTIKSTPPAWWGETDMIPLSLTRALVVLLADVTLNAVVHYGQDDHLADLWPSRTRSMQPRHQTVSATNRRAPASAAAGARTRPIQ